MNQSLPVLAVDVGYGNVKFVMRLPDGKIERKMFPALAPAHLAGTVSSHEFSTKRDTVVVRVDGNNYEVGFDVRDAITPTNSGGDLSDEYTKTPNYTALLYGAIAYSGADTIDCLSLGLPVHIYNQKVPPTGAGTATTVAQVLKNKYLGKQSFGTRTVEIKDVVVIPQPIGTLFWHKQLQKELGLPVGDINLIIDPGYFSTDWIVSNGWKTIDSRCGGRRGGVSEIYRRVANEISTKIGEPFTDLGRIDEAIRLGRPLSIYGKPHEIKPFLTSAEPMIAEVVKVIKNSIETSSDISSVVITGGGAPLFQNEVAASFSKNNVVLLDDGVFSNAKGFLLAGEAKLARSARTEGDKA